MKKVILSAMILLGTLTLSAQDYVHSIGVNVGSMYGVSYKGFIFGIDGLALQADLGVRLSTTSSAISGNINYKQNGSTTNKSISDTKDIFGKSVNPVYFTFEVNPNIVYQQPITDFGWGSLSWFAGGGVSVGLMKWADEWGHMNKKENKVGGKFGINGLGGLELGFSGAPLAMSFDFRPGYGLAFKSDKQDDGMGGTTETRTTASFFDWALVLGLRYCF